MFLKVNLRVVSTVCPLDRTVTQLLHDKPNIDELMVNLALAVIDLIHFAQLILQKLCNALLTKREVGIWHFFETIAAFTWPTIERAPDADQPSSMFFSSPFVVNAITDMMPTNDEKGTYFCVSFPDVFEVVFCHNPLLCSNRLKFSMVFFEVFIKSFVQYTDFKLSDSTNFHDLCFSERGQVVSSRFFGLFTMPIKFVLSSSTIDTPDVQALRVGNINYGCFIKDMGMLWRKDVVHRGEGAFQMS